MAVDLSENDRFLSAPRVHAGQMSEAMTAESYGYAPTPLGRVLVITAGDELVGLHFDGHARTPEIGARTSGAGETLSAVAGQLDEYFRGVRTGFDLPLRLEGTPFQRKVWAALLDIPFGQTSTYAEVAARIGRPRAVRAVGAANGQNPISIVVPCHRLIGANGDLTGYGWGLERKRSLLELEGADLRRRPAKPK
jgi:methylated-DNA-[protein]-cysteine S-methyltransferase